MEEENKKEISSYISVLTEMAIILVLVPLTLCPQLIASCLGYGAGAVVSLKTKEILKITPLGGLGGGGSELIAGRY